MMLCEKIQSFTAAFREEDRGVLGREGGLNKFAIDGRIISDQDLEVPPGGNAFIWA
jgi:hypothetical protein